MNACVVRALDTCDELRSRSDMDTTELTEQAGLLNTEVRLRGA